MRSLFAAIATLLVTIAAPAQSLRRDPMQFVPKADIALGYNFIYANAPPGQPQDFSMNGGFVSASVVERRWVSIAGEVTGGHAKDISDLGQDLTLITYAAGPRLTSRTTRMTRFVQVLVGGAHGSDSYFPTGNSYSTSANSFAFSAGGGIDINFSHHLAVRALEAQYLHTQFHNGVNTSQNQLQLGAGVLMQFGGGLASERSSSPTTMPARHISLTCTPARSNVTVGQLLEIDATAKTQPDDESVTFLWTSSGGVLTPRGNIVTVDTSGMAPGTYRVTGQAQFSSDGAITRSCTVPFRVFEHKTTAPSTIIVNSPAAPEVSDDEFHTHVPDAYFDYDKWSLRQDTLEAINEAALFLKAHPKLRVLVGGYSDERGTPEYNLSLGEKRANTARDALVAAGVDPARIQVVSYGKGVQVCTTPAEPCYQRNRRAAFMMQP